MDDDSDYITDDEIDDIYEELDETDENEWEMSGGNDNTEIVDNTLNKIEKLKPFKTRNTISIFEYSRVLTALSRYLFDINDLSKYVKNENLSTIIHPCELAFNLLEEGVFDAILDRGIEKVSYSSLLVNKYWKKLLTNSFDKHNQSLRDDFLAKINN